MDKKMIDATEITYHDAGYVANQLQVKTNTLRKYASIIEEILSNKNRFRHDNAARSYSDVDVDLIKKALRMHDEAGVTLKDAFKSVFVGHDLVVSDGGIMPDVMPNRDGFNQLLKQNEELKAQNANIIRQNEALKLKLDQVLARLPNEADVDQPKSKRSFWNRLTGRN